MTPCTPAPPCDLEYPLLCEPLETTASGKRLVVEDSAACQKTIQTPPTGQVLTSNNGTLGWTNGGNATVLSKSSTGNLEFGKVQTDYIVDSAITTTKIADSAVTTSKIADGAVVVGVGSVVLSSEQPKSRIVMNVNDTRTVLIFFIFFLFVS